MSGFSKSAGLQLAVDPTLLQAIDFISCTVTLANGASQALPVGRGLVVIDNQSSRGNALYFTGANGGVVLIAQNSAGTEFVTSNTAGKTGLALNGGNTAYTLYNNTGGTVTYVVAMTRTGPIN